MLTIQPTLADEVPSHSWWRSIVDQIAANDPSAMEVLYRSLQSIRFEIIGKIGRDRADDVYHDAILLVFGAIQTGRVRVPEALPAFTRRIVERRLYAVIKETVLARAMLDPSLVTIRDHSMNPEQQLLQIQKRDIAARALRSLPTRQREVLTRFYLDRESAAEIQHSMRLTETQFRLMKSRAKACFGERGRAHLARTHSAVTERPDSTTAAQQSGS
jgi:RNA polymerase sigma factor (sigma-70 family)